MSKEEASSRGNATRETRTRASHATFLRGIVLHTLYDGLIVLVFLLGLPFLLFRIATSPKYRAGLTQRLGLRGLAAPGRPTIWVHGVSVGEVSAAAPMVRELERTYPDHRVVISTTTMGGQEVARRLLGDRYIFYFPLDFGPVVRRFMQTLKPDLIVLVELELWPNHLFFAHRAGIPVVVVNGRITERSWRGYRRLGRFLPQMDRVSFFAVQNEIYRRRLLDLGVEENRIRITGNMKYDALDLECDSGRRRSLRQELALGDSDRVLVGGSTHDDEELRLFRVYARLKETCPELRLVLVPRRLERVSEIVKAIGREGSGTASLQRVTDIRAEAKSPSKDSVFVLDTLGELASFYRIADLVFVGGSLVPHGGQNMMEPAGLGCPVLFGPHTSNFEDDVALLLGHRAAVQVANETELEHELGTFLLDPERALGYGARAREVVRTARGATERNLEIIDEFIAQRPHGRVPQ